MCGIAGIISNGGIGDDHRPAVEAMLDKLAHRGPDGRAIRADDHAVFGHTRLAIIDPACGQQPIANEDDSIWIIANGEIYNHRALRRELIARGHKFRTGADTEAALHLYEDIGDACLERLHGMFALAIWDRRRRRLLLARDPLGVKPLYYTQVGNRIAFASQLDALMQWPAVERTVSIQSLHEYLAFHYVPSPRSILSGVSKLRPAERLIACDGRLRTEQYWDVSFRSDQQRSDDDWMEMIRRGIDQNTRAHMLSDVPVGAFLSGGLDSSAVASAMHRASSDPVRTFTAGFDDPRFDERAAARALAKRIGADHSDCVIVPDPGETVDALSRCFDEPFADPSAIPTYEISRLAARDVKCVLSGDGGDEVFAGYSRYRRHRRQRLLRRVANAPVSHDVIGTLASGMGRRIGAAAANLTAPHDRAHYMSVAWFDPRETRGLLSPDAIRALGEHDPFDALAHHFDRCETDNPLQRSQYVDIKTWLADGVLCKTDRAAMAHGLEVRVPLLDARWVQTMAALPDKLKIRGRVGKIALRRALAPDVGPDIVNRRKQGFEVPLDDWFKGPLREITHDLLLAHGARVTQWLNPRAIADAWSALEKNRRGIGARLWSLLMLETWLRRHAATLPQPRTPTLTQTATSIRSAPAESAA